MIFNVNNTSQLQLAVYYEEEDENNKKQVVKRPHAKHIIRT